MSLQTKDRLENYVEVTHAVARIDWLEPDGSRSRVLVDNPRLTSDDPKMLRVSVPRKGMTFKVIDQIEELGLYVADVWQHDRDKDDDRIMLKIEPRTNVEGDESGEQREGEAAL